MCAAHLEGEARLCAVSWAPTFAGVGASPIVSQEQTNICTFKRNKLSRCRIHHVQSRANKRLDVLWRNKCKSNLFFSVSSFCLTYIKQKSFYQLAKKVWTCRMCPFRHFSFMHFLIIIKTTCVHFNSDVLIKACLI